MGHQVQSGSRGRTAALLPPPGEGDPAATWGRCIPKAHRASGPGHRPACRSPTLTSAAPAPRRDRKCVMKPWPSLSRSSFSPSRWCPGPAPCRQNHSAGELRALCASPGSLTVVPLGGLKARIRRARRIQPGRAPGTCILVKLPVQPDLGVSVPDRYTDTLSDPTPPFYNKPFLATTLFSCLEIQR